MAIKETGQLISAISLFPLQIYGHKQFSLLLLLCLVLLYLVRTLTSLILICQVPNTWLTHKH
jgi:hypothetical protein